MLTRPPPTLTATAPAERAYSFALMSGHPLCSPTQRALQTRARGRPTNTHSPALANLALTSASPPTRKISRSARLQPQRVAAKPDDVTPHAARHDLLLRSAPTRPPPPRVRRALERDPRHEMDANIVLRLPPRASGARPRAGSELELAHPATSRSNCAHNSRRPPRRRGRAGGGAATKAAAQDAGGAKGANDQIPAHHLLLVTRRLRVTCGCVPPHIARRASASYASRSMTSATPPHRCGARGPVPPARNSSAALVRHVAPPRAPSTSAFPHAYCSPGVPRTHSRSKTRAPRAARGL